MSQTQQVLAILKSGRRLTPAYAWQLGITRLAARVCELREAVPPVRIVTEIVRRNGKRWASYRLSRD